MRATPMKRSGMRNQLLSLVTFVIAAVAAGACGELTGPESPSTPTNVVATLVNPTTVTVTWTPSPLNDGVISYSVYRNGTKVGESNGTETTYTDTGLTPQQTYVYTVAANCVGGVVSDRSLESPASTVLTRDVTPPTVVSTIPLSNATQASPSANVNAVFSEPMDPATINTTTFTLRVTNGAAIPGTVTYDAVARRATLTPIGSLPNPANITATVTTGAKDVAGNALASAFSWTFSTRDDAPPTVIATSPANAATGVSPNALITITFSEAMDQSTVTASNITLRLQSSGAAVAAIVTYDATTRVATVTPTAPLAQNTNYNVLISAALKDLAGNPLTALLITFRTGDTAAPTVVSTSPADLATGVPVGTTVTATFSEAMDETTINTTTFTVRPTSGGAALAGTVTYNATTNTATFTPTAPLAGSTVYSAIITTGVRDAGGNALAANKTWTFVTADITPPTVASVVPANAATGVALNTTVRVTFSEAMDASTISGTNLSLRPTSSSTPVAAVVTYEAGTNTAVITPNAPLSGTTGYTVTVTTGVKDAAGNSLAGQFTSTFTTLTPDVTAPTVTNVVPADNATNVATNTTVRVTFSEPMDQTTINTTNITLRTTSPSVAVTGTVSYDAATRVATFTPSAPLASSTDYTVTVTTGVKDASGNALASQFVSDFTTASSDVTAPTIVSRVPTAGATGVAVNTNVTVTFSEVMDAATINTTTITLAPTAGGSPVAATVGHSAGTATLNPNADLTPGTSYTVTVTTGVKDVAGNALAAQSTWTFTTAAADVTPPTVAQTTPIGATDASVNTDVVVTFSEAMDVTTITTTTFTLTRTSGAGAPAGVTGVISYDTDTRRATFNPTGSLVAGAFYTVTVVGGASGVKDLAGNPLAANFTFNFQTAP